MVGFALKNKYAYRIAPYGNKIGVKINSKDSFVKISFWAGNIRLNDPPPSNLLPLLASSPTATAERVVTLILIPPLLVGEDANKGSKLWQV